MTLWGRLALNDISVRYQRSLIGPFWITLTMLVFVLSVGVLYSGLMGQQASAFIHFLAVGLVAWFFFSATVIEGCSVLISDRELILNTTINPFVLILRVVARNLIIMAHNLPILLLTGYLAWPSIGFNVPLFLFGLLLLILNAGWIATVLAILSARFRDVPPLVTAVMQLLFILSPIIWTPEVLPQKSAFVYLNPLAYYIDAVRDPLIDKAFNWIPYGFSIATLVVGVVMTFLLFRQCRDRIAYWV